MRLLMFTSCVLFTLVPPALADGLLSGAEVKKLFPGTFHVIAPGVTIEVKFAKGGGISGATDKGDTDKGRWRIAGDRVCVKFKKWLDHQEKCERLTMAGSEIKGSVFSVWKR